MGMCWWLGLVAEMCGAPRAAVMRTWAETWMLSEDCL